MSVEIVRLDEQKQAFEDNYKGKGEIVLRKGSSLKEIRWEILTRHPQENRET